LRAAEETKGGANTSCNSSIPSATDEERQPAVKQTVSFQPRILRQGDQTITAVVRGRPAPSECSALPPPLARQRRAQHSEDNENDATPETRRISGADGSARLAHPSAVICLRTVQRDTQPCRTCRRQDSELNIHRRPLRLPPARYIYEAMMRARPPDVPSQRRAGVTVSLFFSCAACAFAF